LTIPFDTRVIWALGAFNAEAPLTDTIMATMAAQIPESAFMRMGPWLESLSTMSDQG
jgi:hypothetical protein